MAQVGGHAHFGDADQMALQRVVTDVAALQDFAQHVAHLLADAEQADRTSFWGFIAAHQSFASVEKVSRLLAGSAMVISHDPQSCSCGSPGRELPNSFARSSAMYART